MLRFNKHDPSGCRGRNLCSGSSFGSRSCAKYQTRGTVPPSCCDEGTELTTKPIFRMMTPCPRHFALPQWGEASPGSSEFSVSFLLENPKLFQAIVSYVSGTWIIVRQVREFCLNGSCLSCITERFAIALDAGVTITRLGSDGQK